MDKLLEETLTRVMMHEKYFNLTAKCFSGVVNNFKRIDRNIKKSNIAIFSLAVYAIVSSIDKNQQIDKLRKEVAELKKPVEDMDECEE